MTHHPQLRCKPSERNGYAIAGCHTHFRPTVASTAMRTATPLRT